MLTQMLILAYRNSDGFLRVQDSKVVYDSRRNAAAYAAYKARLLGVTVRVLDFAPEVASYEPGGDNFDWRAAGWYCQHSYEFCTPCFAGYDHPADANEAAELEAYEAFHDAATTGD